MTKLQIKNRIVEIDRNIEMIFFNDIIEKLKKEKEELLNLLKESEECCDNCKLKEGCIEEDWLNDSYDEDGWCEHYKQLEE